MRSTLKLLRTIRSLLIIAAVLYYCSYVVYSGTTNRYSYRPSIPYGGANSFEKDRLPYQLWSNCVAWWTFPQTNRAGTQYVYNVNSAFDTNDMKVVGGTWTNLYSGTNLNGAMYFDGIDDWLQGAQTSGNITGAMTCYLVMAVLSHNSQFRGVIAKWGTGSTTKLSWAVYLNSSGALQLGLSSDGANNQYFRAQNVTITTGILFHAACTYSTTSSINWWNVTQHGIDPNNAVAGGAQIPSIYTSTQDITIGNFNGNIGFPDYANMLLLEVLLFNKELATNELDLIGKTIGNYRIP